MNKPNEVVVEAVVEEVVVVPTSLSKIDVVFGVLDAHYTGPTDKLATKATLTFNVQRKDMIAEAEGQLIEQGVCTKYEIKPNLVPAYYQMYRLEKTTGSRYSHHKYKKVAAKKAAEAPVEVQNVIPEGTKYQAAQGETIEYFTNRKLAGAFAKAQEGDWEVTKYEAVS